MSELTPILERVKREGDLRALVHDIDQRLRSHHLTIHDLYSLDAQDELSTVKTNPGYISKRDENGFTHTQIRWADMYERNQSYLEAELHHEEARAKVISDFKLTKEKDQHILDKVLGRNRKDVNEVLRRRGLI